MDKVNKYWLIILTIILINVIGYLTLQGNALVLLSDLLPIVCSIIAIFGISVLIKTLKEFDVTKKVWLLLLIGLILDFLAESIYTYLEIVLKYDMNETFPSLADFFWFAAYICFFISLFMMLTYYMKSGLPLGKIKRFIVLTAILVALIILIINFILVPILKDQETSIQTKIASLFYPVADVLVVSLAVILMFIINQFDNKLISMPWKLLALGFIGFTVSDLIYSYLSWEGKYNNGNFIDIGWNLGYLLLGISGLYQLKLMNSVKERG